MFSFLLSSGTSSESFFFQRGHLYLHKMKFRGKLAHAAKNKSLGKEVCGEDPKGSLILRTMAVILFWTCGQRVWGACVGALSFIGQFSSG